MSLFYIMKQYIIDELRSTDYKKVRAYLDENFESSSMDGLYWIPLDQEMLSDIQAEHTECQPFYFAIDVEPEVMSCELLVRSKNIIRCNCIGYATELQRNWIIQVIDAIFEKLEIKT
ncbi:MAG: hypothetical protein JRD93_03670 [Deltaproteobacteria bacterium]|nr:hypothetical protein [Deltaproteobacteria bacterium]